jgi:hypothetical protein
MITLLLEHFPKPFHVQRRENEFWTGHSPNFSSAPDCGRRSIWTTSPNAKEGRLSLRDGDATVVDHVCTISLGGHTVGTHTLVVDPPSATVVLASDAVHYLEEWRRICRLRWWDLPATYVAFDTLNELGAKGAREAGVIMSGRLKHLPRTDSWGAVTDLLDAR